MKPLVTLCVFASLCVSVLGISLSRSLGNRTQFRCDYDYVKEANIWLKVHEMPTNWHEARLRCHMEGASLASPLDSKIQAAMVKLISDKNVMSAAFTGISDTFSTGVFTSVEGIPLSKIHHTWTKYEPNNYKDKEKCISMLPDGTLADTKCTDTFPFMCYKKKPLDVLETCGTPDDEYFYLRRTSHCYKFHNEPSSWSRAYKTCAAEGGYLVIINSNSEASFIKDLVSKYTITTTRKLVFVGFHYWNDYREWRTVHGQTLKEAGYFKYLPGEFKGKVINEFCGSINTNALLNDENCDTPLTFICEKEPKSLACADF